MGEGSFRDRGAGKRHCKWILVGDADGEQLVAVDANCLRCRLGVDQRIDVIRRRYPGLQRGVGSLLSSSLRGLD